MDIEDEDPHKYCCIIRFRETIGEETWDWASGWSSMRADLGTATSADINLTEPDYRGNCLNAAEHPWGTYTYEVLVLEYTGDDPVWTQGEALDWNFIKRYKDGYHLWVPDNLPSPNGDDPGHDVWTHVPEEGGAQMQGYYCLASDYTNAQVDRGNDAEIVVVDPLMSEKGSTAGPGEVDQIGASYGTVDSDSDDEWDGLKLYAYQSGDPAGTWRAIFCAEDKGGIHSPQWRTHDPLRMLTANQKSGRPCFYLWVDAGDDSFNLSNENVYWSHVKKGLHLYVDVPYQAFAVPLKRPISTRIADGAYLTEDQVDSKWANYHTTTIFDCDQLLNEHIPGFTRCGKSGANGQPETPDRSRAGIFSMETSLHNPDPEDTTCCKWGNTQLILHECGWAGGTTVDAEQENGSVMDATNDRYFYQEKRWIWGDDPELYWDHVNDIRAHIGYPIHPRTPQEYR